MSQVGGKGPNRHPPTGEDPDSLRRRAGVDDAGTDQDARAPQEQELDPTQEAVVTGQYTLSWLHTASKHLKWEIVQAVNTVYTVQYSDSFLLMSWNGLTGFFLFKNNFNGIFCHSMSRHGLP